jgi:hypothetical protein
MAISFKNFGQNMAIENLHQKEKDLILAYFNF